MNRTLYAALAALTLTAAAPGLTATKVAVFPITFLDTSNEVGDQAAVHAKRQRAMAAEVAATLGKQAGVTATTTSDEELHGKCPTNDADCQLALARGSGAAVILVTTVHKVSSLIMNVVVRLVDTKDNRTTWGRDLSFRADSDDSWSRAARYIAGEVGEALAAPGK